MIEPELIQTREQAIQSFDVCASCGRKVYEIETSPEFPSRFNFIVVRWNCDPDDLRLVCHPCLRVYNFPAPPIRFYS